MNQLLAIPLEFRLVACFVLGALLGSFINFGIYRFAWNQRLISPWSAAPPGAQPRTWSDRLPIIGWLGLRREAEHHGPWFWIRPMLIELGAAAGLAALYWWEVEQLALFQYSMRVAAMPLDRALAAVDGGLAHWPLLAHVILITLMTIATFIDIDEKTIPDEVTLSGTLIGLTLAVISPWSLLPGRTYVLKGGPFTQESEFLQTASPLPWPDVLSGGPPRMLSLVIAWACFGLWCFALLPRTWHGRYGWRRACRYFVAKIIRDRFSWLVFGVAVVGTVGISAVWGTSTYAWNALLTSLIGMAAGMVVIWAVRLLGQAVLKKEAMGFGDVTLMAMIGAFVGWQPSLIIFFLAPLAGLVVGVLQFVFHRENVIPYGPFLCLATLLTLIRWSTIWDYLLPAFHMGWFIPLIMIACLGIMAVLLFLIQGIKRLIWGRTEG